MDVIVARNSEPDDYSTFSCEADRTNPSTALRKKIMKTLSMSGEAVGIGSEGRFGPSRQIPCMQVHHEVVMLIDLEHDLEIMEDVVSTETNYTSMEIGDLKDLHGFTEKINFPWHGIILKQLRKGNAFALRRGIGSWEELYAVFHQLNCHGARIIAETDMRGYLNPTRMKVVERATELLMKRVNRLCPECHYPGFGVVDVQYGLSCEACSPSDGVVMTKVYQCKHCTYTDQRFYGSSSGTRCGTGCERVE